MFGKRIKRGVPEINATSTADMAFMLLVFFLLATSMGVKKSIRRELPPSTDSVRVEPLRVKERDLLVLRLDGEGRLFAGPEEIPLTDVKERVKHFIANPDNEESLPEKPSLTITSYSPVSASRASIFPAKLMGSCASSS